jgi:serine O-acetyltransferase
MQPIVRLHKISSFFYRNKMKRISKIIDLGMRLLFQTKIPGGSKVHPTVHFAHNGMFSAIARDTELGARVTIGLGVVLVGGWPKPGAPIVEDDCIIHTGAVLVGAVRIGAGSVIGANAVVTTDIPPRSLAVGIPARVKRSDIDIREYHFPVVMEANPDAFQPMTGQQDKTQP